MELEQLLWSEARRLARSISAGLGSPVYLWYRDVQPTERIAKLEIATDSMGPEWHLAWSEPWRLVWDIDGCTRQIHDILRHLPILGIER